MNALTKAACLVCSALLASACVYGADHSALPKPFAQPTVAQLPSPALLANLSTKDNKSKPAEKRNNEKSSTVNSAKRFASKVKHIKFLEKKTNKPQPTAQLTSPNMNNNNTLLLADASSANNALSSTTATMVTDVAVDTVPAAAGTEAVNNSSSTGSNASLGQLADSISHIAEKNAPSTISTAEAMSTLPSTSSAGMAQTTDMNISTDSQNLSAIVNSDDINSEALLALSGSGDGEDFIQYENFDPQSLEGRVLPLNEAIYISLRFNPDVQGDELARILDKFDLRSAYHDFELQYDFSTAASASATRSAGESSSSKTYSTTAGATLNGVYGTTYALTMSNPYADGIYNPGLDLSISQPLMSGFGRAVTLAPLYDSEDSEVSSRLSLRTSLMSQVSSVISNYRSLIQTQNDVGTTRESLANLAQTIKMDNALIRAGQKAPTEVLQADAQYASQQVDLQDRINSVITGRFTLLDDLGLPPEIAIQVPSDVEIKYKIKPNFETSFNIALKNNPTYLNALINLRQARRVLMVAQDAARTSLTLTVDATTGGGSGGGFNRDLRSLTNNKNTSVSASLAMDVPIQDYSLKRGILSAKIDLTNAEIGLVTAKRQLKTTILNDITTVISSLKQVELAEHALQLEQENQDFLNAKLRFGLVSTFEVTQKLTDLNSAKQTLISNKISYLNSLTQLYQDMGILLEKWNIEVVY